MRAETAYFVLYDGDCRVCTACARLLRLFDLRRRIRVQPIQDSRVLLSSIPEQNVLDAAHAVSPDGRVTTGADALPTIAAALVGVPEVEGLLRHSPASMRVFSRFYGLLVEVRGQLTCGLSGPAPEARSPR